MPIIDPDVCELFLRERLAGDEEAIANLDVLTGTMTALTDHANKTQRLFEDTVAAGVVLAKENIQLKDTLAKALKRYKELYDTASEMYAELVVLQLEKDS